MSEGKLPEGRKPLTPSQLAALAGAEVETLRQRVKELEAIRYRLLIRRDEEVEALLKQNAQLRQMLDARDKE